MTEIEAFQNLIVSKLSLSKPFESMILLTFRCINVHYCYNVHFISSQLKWITLRESCMTTWFGLGLEPWFLSCEVSYMLLEFHGRKTRMNHYQLFVLYPYPLPFPSKIPITLLSRLLQHSCQESCSTIVKRL